MVPDALNISLDAALKQEPRLAELAEKDPDVAELIQICRVLEGLPRHASTHAAGVVIADRPLVDYLPLYKGKKGEVVTQFDMKIVEKIGLVKFDFLGLRNLTVIANTLDLLERHQLQVAGRTRRLAERHREGSIAHVLGQGHLFTREVREGEVFDLGPLLRAVGCRAARARRGRPRGGGIP